MFKRKKFKYSDLPPGDRIRKLMEEYVAPELSKIGFKLLKSKLTLKRKIGNFTQEIHISKSDRNFGNTVVCFWAILSVNSNFYVKWHEKTYGIKPINEIIDAWYDNHIETWKSKYRSGTKYDLTQFDNVKLMNDLTKNILNIGVPLLNEVANWESAADYLLKHQKFGSISKIFDAYILANKKEKAIQSLHIAEEFFKTYEDVPEERLTEIKIRKDYLQALNTNFS